MELNWMEWSFIYVQKCINIYNVYKCGKYDSTYLTEQISDFKEMTP